MVLRGGKRMSLIFGILIGSSLFTSQIVLAVLLYKTYKKGV